MATLSEHDIEHWRDWLVVGDPAPNRDEQRASETDTAATEDTAEARPAKEFTRRVRTARRRWLITATAGIAATAAAGTGLAFASFTDSPHPLAPRPPHASAPTPTPTPDLALGGGPGCEPTKQSGLVRGNGPGSLRSGPDAILMFQHGYYNLRSGAAARAATTVDAQVPSAADIDAGIATVATGTTACVVITPLDADHYQVTVTETHPDGTLHTFVQAVTTANDGTDVRITAIRPGT